MSDREKGLAGMFRPGSIAVIGASSNPEKLTFKLVRNIIEGEYPGDLYPVNLRGGSVCGLDALRSIEDLPEGIDLAFIGVPAGHVAASLEECGKKGISFAVVISAGFSEAGNKDGEMELLEIARKYDMRILGPNVFGFINTSASLNAQFGPSDIIKGHIGIISQSGIMGAAMAEKMFQQGGGISSLFATGNKADIGDAELLDHLKDDDDTKAVLMYVEGVKDGSGLLEAGRRFAEKKPLIILKGGRTMEGARAVRSHTASLAGEKRVFEGVARQMGALRASTLKEGIDWAISLVNMPRPDKYNVFVITNGGGFAVLAVDMLQEVGIPLYDGLAWIEREMAGLFPGYAVLGNPLDMTAAPSYEDYARALKLALDEETIGAVLGIYSPTSGVDVKGSTRILKDALADIKKPVVLCTMGSEAVMGQIKDLNQAGIPTFFFPEEAVSSLSALFARERLMKRSGERGEACVWDLNGVGSVIDGKSGFLSAADSLKVLSNGHIDVPPFYEVENREDALAKAGLIGYPVVLKASDPGLVHKTDKGAVIAGIGDEDQLANAFNELKKMSVKLLVMGHVEGREVITGAVRDGVFGPCVMAGLGGIMVEALNDVSFRSFPISDEDGLEMLSDLKGQSILNGFRGGPSVDRRSIVDVLKALGSLLLEVEEIEEIEVNPLMATDAGCTAADCRIKLR